MQLQHIQVAKDANIVASATLGTTFANPDHTSDSTGILFIQVKSAPTGSSPTLAVTLNGSIDGTHSAYITGSADLTSVGNYRVVCHDVIEPFLSVYAIVSAGAAFPDVTVDYITI